MNLQAVLQSRTIDIDQLLELSDSQKKELMSLPRKYNDKIKKEIELTSKEKIADADPLRMEEFAKDVLSCLDRKWNFLNWVNIIQIQEVFHGV
jgi:hypothetical protein